MGVFDLFGRDPKNKNESETGFSPGERGLKRTSSPFETDNKEQKNPVSVFIPTSYEEVEKIIDTLKNKKTAVVHLTNLKTETALRILDMLSGAIYALGGGVYEMEKNIFMFSPEGVEVHC